MKTSWHNWEGKRQQLVHKVPFSRCKLMPCTITQEWQLLIPLLSIKWLITMLWWVTQWHYKIITIWRWLDSSRWCRTQCKLWMHLGTRKGLQVIHNLPFTQCNQHKRHKEQWFLVLPPMGCILCKLPKLLLLSNQWWCPNRWETLTKWSRTNKCRLSNRCKGCSNSVWCNLWECQWWWVASNNLRLQLRLLPTQALHIKS